ncbi:pyrroline-5-carboxylate reductase [Streptococcus ovuberis]|uniref:Pyrroline-5-carboxylate reductase n=1 Tax=Streptococcus ovuberis TaxID=1936207 RepID=A0A7X6MZH1_9STRE|nr:pyrroline-5-carboxylate reductase [Streptococcus ovuberis]NKZ20648.1 pyrroline-5-carboxylate reductase [Streptococcus ovuberis]
MKIGVIGIGNMGAAIARAVASAGYELVLSNHNPDKARALAKHLSGAEVASNQDINESCQVIFLGLKPSQMVQFLIDQSAAMAKNPEALWISMVAGMTLERLSALLPQESGLIRMMPNTPVAVGQGMTTYALKDTARSLDDQVLFETLMAKSGQLLKLPEHLMDSATGIAGCGPAFVYQFIEALADAGVQNGLQRADSLALAAQTLLGAAQLVLDSGQHPAVLRDQVTSPGGSTIAGIVALEENGFRHAAISAVNCAIARTKELGN